MKSKLLWCAWGLFLLSLALPAVKLNWGAWNQPDAGFAVGFGCALWFPPFYASNVLMLLAPLLFWCCRFKKLSGWPRHVLAVLYALSFIGALACIPMFLAVHAGYVCWVLSFALLATALWMMPAQRADVDV